MAMAASAAACKVMAGAREAAVHLPALLQATGSKEHGNNGKQEQLAEQIICCIDRARDALRAGACDDSEGPTDEQGLAARPPAGSKRRYGFGSLISRARGCGGEARARVVISSTMDDGYAWRKYGEKSIQDRRNPRFYFRCAYRDDLRCGARKQVERTEDDPSLFHVAYFGEHTPACPRDSRFVLPSSLDGFRPCSPAEGSNKELTANMVEFAVEYLPVKDQLADLVSSGISFASPGGELESLDASLEELMGLLS